MVALRALEFSARTLRQVEGAPLAEAQQIVREACRHYQEVLQPIDDLHGSVAYKTYLTGVLLSRALAQAVGTDGR